MSSLQSKYRSAVKISLIFLILSSLYILFSDYLILRFLGDSMQLDDLNRIQSYKGLAFVFLTSVLLFFLIRREIGVAHSYIRKLEEQQGRLKKLTAEKNEVARKFYTQFLLSPTPIVITRLADQKILEVNSSFLKLFNYSKKDIIGSKLHQTTIWANAEERNEMLAALKNKGTIREFESKALQRNGRSIDTLSYLQIVEINREKAIIEIILDITEKKQNERELKKSKTLLEKTLNTLDQAVFFVNPESREIQLVNNAVKKVFGYEPEEIVGKNTKILHVNTELYNKFGEVGNPILEKNGFFHITYQMKHKSGKIIETENSVTAIYDEDGWRSGVVSVVRDVTAQRKAEKQLQEYHDSLRQLTMEISLAEEKQRKHIAANIHDHLSQLLVIAKIRLDELTNRIKYDKDIEDLAVISDYITEALEKTRKITYDLSPPVLYEMGLVEAMHWLSEKVSDEHNIMLQFQSEFDKIDFAEPKLILIYRVIMELVNNAVKHANPKIVKILFSKKNNKLSITVADDGKGFLADGASATKFQKSGFGLFAVRERINNLDGSFDIRSKPGIGTEVNILIPLKEKD